MEGEGKEGEGLPGFIGTSVNRVSERKRQLQRKAREGGQVLRLQPSFSHSRRFSPWTGARLSGRMAGFPLIWSEG